jgi:hypothetical protein
MKRSEIEAKEAELLYEIYKNKEMTLRQINAIYFNTYITTRLYMKNLERKGLVKKIYTLPDPTRRYIEHVYFLTMPGIELLRKKGFKTGSGALIPKYLINPNEHQIRHDLKLVDIIIYLFTNNLIEDYTTELFLRQIRYSEKKDYRIPDIAFKDKHGYGFVELEEKPRKSSKLFADVRDYRIQYKEFRKIFIVPEARINFYKDILAKTALAKYEIHTFENQKLIKKFSK